jgi:hypothetical protein
MVQYAFNWRELAIKIRKLGGGGGESVTRFIMSNATVTVEGQV